MRREGYSGAIKKGNNGKSRWNKERGKGNDIEQQRLRNKKREEWKSIIKHGEEEMKACGKRAWRRWSEVKVEEIKWLFAEVKEESK